MKNLENKWVLITGAASGIGQALAWKFAAAGSNLVIADINENGMQKTAAQAEARGRKVISIRADLSIPQEVEMLASRSLKEAGQVDILVNNAGVFLMSEAKNLTRDDWERILAVNLHGPILLTHCLLPHMIARRSGHIVNIASVCGLMGLPVTAPYSVTKFGLVGFSEALRAELHQYGIAVTAICPGIIVTPMINKKYLRGIDLDVDIKKPPRLVSLGLEQAAQEIIRGVRRNQAKVIPATITVKLLLAVKWASPGLAEMIIRNLFLYLERLPI